MISCAMSSEVTAVSSSRPIKAMYRTKSLLIHMLLLHAYVHNHAYIGLHTRGFEEVDYAQTQLQNQTDKINNVVTDKFS